MGGGAVEAVTVMRALDADERRVLGLILASRKGGDCECPRNDIEVVYRLLARRCVRLEIFFPRADVILTKLGEIAARLP